MTRALRMIFGATVTAVIASSCMYLERVSVDAGGDQYDERTNATDVTADGLYVVFSTREPLSSLDTNTVHDVYRKNTLTGAVHLASRDGATVGNSTSGGAVISDDGRFIAFESKATNLTGAGPADTNGHIDVFLHDVTTLATVRISLTEAGAEANASSYDATISGDGDIVAFTSDAGLDPIDGNGVSDIYVYGSGPTIEAASANYLSGLFLSGASRNAALGPDGDFIAFESDAALGGGSAFTDIYTRSVPDGFPLSPTSGADDGSYQPAIDDSGFGATIVFESDATNLVPADTNGVRDVFVHDALLSTTERVSVDSSGAQSDGDSGNATVTDSGDLIAFETTSPVVHGFASGRRSVVHDVDDGRTTGVRDVEVEARSTVLSGNGLYVLFSSNDAVISPDANGSDTDAFLEWWSDAEATAVAPSTVPAGAVTPVTITGSGFNRLADTDVWTHYGDTEGISFNNIVIVDDQTITADIVVAAWAATTTYPVAVEASGDGPGLFSGALAICADCLDVS